MSADLTLRRLRWLLMALAGFMFLCSLAELVFTEHTEEPLQWVPFVLCGLALVALGIVWLRPARGTFLALRWTMALVLAGSLFGVYEHLSANLAFAQEIQPNATAGALVWEMLSGASPLLAPGILGIAAVLALAATYNHPGLAAGQV